MKKQMLWRDTLREIKRSRNRFISILLIVFLGAGFFVGVKATAPSIRNSAEKYFNEGNLFDIMVMSPAGLSDEDIEELRKTEGVEGVMPSYSVDVTLKEDSLTAVKVASVPKAENKADLMNAPLITEGRFPEASGECIVANNRFLGNTYKLGDKIVIAETVGDTDVSDYLGTLEYTVVGFFNSPLYFSYTYGNTSVGDGTVSVVIYVNETDFTSPRYTEAYVSIERPENITTFDSEYENAVLEVVEHIEPLGFDRLEVFRDEYGKKVDEAIETLNKEKADAEIKLNEAKSELDDAKAKLDDAIAEITEGWAEFNAQKNEALSTLSDAEAELLDGKKTFEENKAALEKAEAEYADAKSKIDIEFVSAKKELNSAKKQLDEARKEYNKYLSDYEAGLSKFNTEKKKYDDAVAAYNKGKADYDKGLSDYESGYAAYNDGLKKYNDGLLEYNKGLLEYQKNYDELMPYLDQYYNGLAEYQQGVAKYDLGKSEYDAQKQYFDEKKAEYDAAYQEYIDNLALYNSTKAQLGFLKTILSEAEYEMLLRELELSKIQLENAKRQLDAAKKELDRGEAELKAAEKELNAAKAELDAAKKELDDAWAELEGPSKELDKAKKELDQADKTLTESKKELDSTKIKLDEAKVELAAAEKELADGKKEIDAATPEIKAAEAEINDAKKQLDKAKADLDAGEKKYNDGQKKYDSEYSKATKELKNAENEIEDARKQLADAEALITEKEKELNDAKAEIDLEFADAEAELNDAQAEVDKGQADYDAGLLEYNDSVAEYESSVASAEADINSLKDLIAGTEGETWYSLNRDDAVTQYGSLKDDCGRLDAIVNVFPVFFLAVACLVCLTTMTRMIDEQRTQMGTYKALGYSSADIKKKYYVYALLASIIGGVIGIAVCVQILPRVIYSAYNVLYLFSSFDIVMPWDMAVISILISVLCIIIITEICARRELNVTTAALMRPKAPKAGKKILLERIGFFWNHLGFSMKVTLRNLFRYKLRLAMTIVGISGCMMLMVAGFGLQNSILAIVDKQYGEILTNDIDLYPAESMDKAAVDELIVKISEYGFVDESMASLQSSVTVSNGDLSHTEDIVLFVPDNSGKFADFVNMYPVGTNLSHDVSDVKKIVLSDDGVVVTEKLAKILGITEGDVIDLDYEGKTYSVKVDGITKNYVLHNVFMSTSLYDKLIGNDKPLLYNRVSLTLADGNDHDEVISTLLSEVDEVSYAVSIESMGDLLSDMIEGLNMVVVVMIFCAGALAFLVVYNLTNINISERLREIATIKVLGFKMFETNMYVFRENIIMSIVGIIFGSGLGYYLAQFMIETVEVNMTTFERILPASGFIYSALLTLAFTLLVSLFMTRRVKSISMVESLKAIE